MKSKPVRRYSRPKYPTRLEVAAGPGLLQRHQPSAWCNWPELTSAVGLFLLADTARLAAADSPAKNGKSKSPSQAVAVVAPIFQHGEGRGATGCIVMSPPVFLSEEEAMQVIREEMAAKGVELGTNQTAVAGVTVRSPWKQGAQPSRETFRADAADPKRRVFVEFLAEKDARFWDFERMTEGEKLFIGSVHSYDMPKTAAYVAERVKRQATDRAFFGTFYDPVAKCLDTKELVSGLLAERAPSGQAETQSAYAKAKAESRRLLRLQVQDFLKWLQGQGAI